MYSQYGYCKIERERNKLKGTSANRLFQCDEERSNASWPLSPSVVQHEMQFFSPVCRTRFWLRVDFYIAFVWWCIERDYVLFGCECASKCRKTSLKLYKIGPARICCKKTPFAESILLGYYHATDFMIIVIMYIIGQHLPERPQYLHSNKDRAIAAYNALLVTTST